MVKARRPMRAFFYWLLGRKDMNRKHHPVLLKLAESDYRKIQRLARFPTSWCRQVVARALERAHPRKRKG